VHCSCLQAPLESTASICVCTRAGLSIVFAAILTLTHNCRLLSTQGYEDPVPLSKTARGWEPSGGGSEWWSLLGELEVRAGGTVRGTGEGGVRSRFAVLPSRGGGVSTNSSMAGSASEESLMGAGSGSVPRMKREDSGLYDEDVYEKLGV
jgi:hypothetical protein